MIEIGEAVAALEAEFDRVDGFIGQLRSGTRNHVAQERFLRLLGSIGAQRGCVDCRLVQLLWYLPLLIAWQGPRFDESDRKEMERVESLTVSELERILGVP